MQNAFAKKRREKSEQASRCLLALHYETGLIHFLSVGCFPDYDVIYDEGIVGEGFSTGCERAGIEILRILHPIAEEADRCLEGSGLTVDGAVGAVNEFNSSGITGNIDVEVYVLVKVAVDKGHVTAEADPSRSINSGILGKGAILKDLRGCAVRRQAQGTSA